MSIEKKDLNQFKEVVTEVVQLAIKKSEVSLKGFMKEEIAKSEISLKVFVKQEIEKSVQKSEEKIITILTREVVDLSDTIHLVLNKTNQIDNHEQRITRLETKAVRRGR